MAEQLKTIFCSRCGARQTIEAWRTDCFCVNCGYKVYLDNIRLQPNQIQNSFMKEIAIPKSYFQLINLSYDGVEHLFHSWGFNNIMCKGVSTLTRKENSVKDIFVNGKSLLMYWKKSFLPNSLIVIEYYYRPSVSKPDRDEVAGRVLGNVARFAWNEFWHRKF